MRRQTLALLAGLLAPGTATAASFQVIGQFNVSWDVGVVGPPSFGFDLHVSVNPTVTDGWEIGWRRHPSVGPYFQALWGSRPRTSLGVRGGVTWLSLVWGPPHGVVLATEAEAGIGLGAGRVRWHGGARVTGGVPFLLAGSVALGVDPLDDTHRPVPSFHLGVGTQQLLPFGGIPSGPTTTAATPQVRKYAAIGVK